MSLSHIIFPQLPSEELITQWYDNISWKVHVSQGANIHTEH